MTPRNRMLAASIVALVASSAGATRENQFIDDDYDAARVQAKARKVPILAEVWAPW